MGSRSTNAIAKVTLGDADEVHLSRGGPRDSAEAFAGKSGGFHTKETFGLASLDANASIEAIDNLTGTVPNLLGQPVEQSDPHAPWSLLALPNSRGTAHRRGGPRPRTSPIATEWQHQSTRRSAVVRRLSGGVRRFESGRGR